VAGGLAFREIAGFNQCCLNLIGTLVVDGALARGMLREVQLVQRSMMMVP
jgi:hypothetical protein